jgi:TRAP-type C4-dicarboxylate transport system permease small subunit
MVGRLARGYDRLLDGMAALGAAAMLLMALCITYEVVMRYVFNRPTIWAADLSEYALLYSTFLAAPWLVREGGHVRIDTLLIRLTPSQRHVLNLITCVLAAGVCMVLLWQTLDATLATFARGHMVARAWQVPRAAVWAIMPVGSFFLTLEFLRAAIRSARAARSGHPAVEHVGHERAI